MTSDMHSDSCRLYVTAETQARAASKLSCAFLNPHSSHSTPNPSALSQEEQERTDHPLSGAQHAPPIPAQDLPSVFKAGYLEKRRKDHSFFGTEWQKRWCALSSRTFYYYGSEKGMHECHHLQQRPGAPHSLMDSPPITISLTAGRSAPLIGNSQVPVGHVVMGHVVMDKQQKGEFNIDGYNVKLNNSLRKDAKKDCCFEISAPDKRVYQSRPKLKGS
ncbi:hypothetical protein JZ751_009710 [Albula glossodonta]|uniref:PH domain-containing protein n=1 Tax=Albula glossodonta TaxID=121402 RepID=A0A8T2P967_9TELE|nr:hypothetical protein JZ751_009710 [Albula glossodonta]